MKKVIKEAINKELLKDFTSFAKSASYDFDSLNNDQSLWGAMQAYERDRQKTLSKGDVRDIKDYFYSKAYNQASEFYSLESKQGGNKMGKQLNESAITDFHINSKVDVEGKGTGKVELITPDSVTIRFADDSTTVFLADELYKVNLVPEEGEENEPEAGVAPAPEMEPAATEPTIAGEAKMKKALRHFGEAVKLMNKEIAKIKEAAINTNKAVALLAEEDASAGEAGAGQDPKGVEDQKKALDQAPNTPAGTEVPAPTDAAGATATPAPVTAEAMAKALAAKKKISEKEAMVIVKKLFEEDASAGDAGQGQPESDKHDTVDQAASTDTGASAPETKDPDQAASTPAPIAAEAVQKRKQAIQLKLEEMKILSGVTKRSSSLRG